MRAGSLWAIAVITVLVTGTVRAEGKNPMVVMSTSMGDVKIELYEDKAPETVKNFLGYVNDKFYDGTIFHRVIPNFMIQGGGFDKDMKQKATKAPIKNEAGNGLKNDTGTLAMARTSDPNSNGGQFFIVYKDTQLPTDGGGYTIFGTVTSGLDIVKKTAAAGVQGGQTDGPPAQPISIQKVVVTEKKA
jgi:cyclophilin family peptidyl-prolyl cis-trans isomerase